MPASIGRLDGARRSLLRHGALAQVPNMPDTSATWHFWELYAGCGDFTVAVWQLGLQALPLVDTRAPAGYSGQGVAAPVWQMGLSNSANQGWALAMIERARPWWIHVGPARASWSPLARWTAKRRPAERQRLRAQALAHLRFALHVLEAQARAGRHGSLEQPRKRVSWRLPLLTSWLNNDPLGSPMASGGVFSRCDPGDGCP